MNEKTHKKLNWSSTILNKQFRNTLKASNKWVAATDLDLIVYTKKGPAYILEEKNMKQELENSGTIEISKVQIDILLHIQSQLNPKPMIVLCVYDAKEIGEKNKSAKIYIRHITSKVSQKIVGSPKRYVFDIGDFYENTISGFIADICALITTSDWYMPPKIKTLGED